MVRIGVVGYGYWGPNLVRNFAETPGAEVGAVADLDTNKLATVKRRFPAVRTTTNFNERKPHDITDRLPTAPATKNGKRVALVGAGPASLTVANDLLPLGYEVVIFEKYAQPGGLMRFNIPAFRLPAQVSTKSANM